MYCLCLVVKAQIVQAYESPRVIACEAQTILPTILSKVLMEIVSAEIGFCRSSSIVYRVAFGIEIVWKVVLRMKPCTITDVSKNQSWSFVGKPDKR